jgi:hypothetical protein
MHECRMSLRDLTLLEAEVVNSDEEAEERTTPGKCCLIIFLQDHQQ